jgi:hypothetical protein
VHFAAITVIHVMNTWTPLADLAVPALRRCNILRENVRTCTCKLLQRAAMDEEFADQLDSDLYRQSAASHRAYATVLLKEVGQEWREKLMACTMGTSTSYFTVQHEEVHGRILPKLVIAGSSYLALTPGSLCQDSLGKTPLFDLVAASVRESIGAMTPAHVTAWIREEMAIPRDGAMCYTFDCLLPPISGLELLELTPDQLGIRLAIDGVSPIVAAKLVATLLQR